MRKGVNHIDKTDFLQLYQEACSRKLTMDNIRNSFGATGVIPFDPDDVLETLHIRIEPSIPTPPLVPAEPGNWAPKTPHNILEVQLQTNALKRFIRYRTQSPPIPVWGP